MKPDRRLFYQTIAGEFDSLMNPYDLTRRVSIVFDELLQQDLSGRRLLDLGCGTGWFSLRAIEREAWVVSLDISAALARLTACRAQTWAVAGDAGLTPFEANSFDIIISSEMLEHLPHPEQGVREIARLLAPGGTVVVTTPNRRWLWLVKLATQLHVRPFEGYEEFMGFAELHRLFSQYGLVVDCHCGFHPWPFQIGFLQGLSEIVDRRYGRSRWAAWMINQGIRAVKPREQA